MEYKVGQIINTKYNQSGSNKSRNVPVVIMNILDDKILFKVGCCAYKELSKENFHKYIEANKAEEMVTITKKKYDELVEDSKFLMALEAAGVDNWEGYGVAGSWRLSSK